MAVFSKLSLQWECQNIHLDQGQLGYMSLQGEYNQHSYDAGGKTNHQVFHTGSLFIHTSHEVNVKRVLAGYFGKEHSS